MKLKPLGNRVVLKPIEKTQTQDGIYIPDSIKDKPMHFTVQDVGQGWFTNQGDLIPITNVEVGDRVLVQKHAGLEIKVEDGSTRRIVNAAEILAVLCD